MSTRWRGGKHTHMPAWTAKFTIFCLPQLNRYQILTRKQLHIVLFESEFESKFESELKSSLSVDGVCMRTRETKNFTTRYVAHQTYGHYSCTHILVSNSWLLNARRWIYIFIFINFFLSCKLFVIDVVVSLLFLVKDSFCNVVFCLLKWLSLFVLNLLRDEDVTAINMQRMREKTTINKIKQVEMKQRQRKNWIVLYCNHTHLKDTHIYIRSANAKASTDRPTRLSLGEGEGYI